MTDRIERAAEVTHNFIVHEVGYDAGEPMHEQARDLAQALDAAGCFGPNPEQQAVIDAAQKLAAFWHSVAIACFHYKPIEFDRLADVVIDAVDALEASKTNQRSNP